MRSCTPVSIPVAAVEDAVKDEGREDQFLSGWFMAPNNYEEDDVEESDRETEGSVGSRF